ncbi:MAG: GIY-YIG nuclease family protein [Pikeienuella sp.]
MPYAVYILASRSGNALYVGLTNDLARRMAQHRAGLSGAHTERYRITRLVYVETHETYPAALERERRIKRWRRDWKLNLIRGANPTWRDLASDFTI